MWRHRMDAELATRVGAFEVTAVFYCALENKG